MTEIQNLKDTCEYKLSQGDVNIYRLKKRPNIETTPHKGFVLVTGDGGHIHSATKAKAISLTSEGAFIVEASSDGVEFSHNGKHQPPFHCEKGWYLVDRAREKNMLTDMVAPVAD